MMLRRREYKHKLCEAGIVEECNITVDPDKYENQIPKLIEKIQNERADMRLASLKAMNELFTSRYFGIYIQDYAPTIFDSLMTIIDNPTSNSELNEALLVSCTYSLSADFHYQEDFQFVNELLAHLPELDKQSKLKPFTIAFLLYYCTKEQSSSALNQILILLTNKKQRGAEYDSTVIAAMLNAVAMILSKDENASEQRRYEDLIQTSLNNAFESSKPDIILSGIHLLKVFYHNLVVTLSDELNTEKYKNKLITLESKVERKEDKRSIREAVTDILTFFSTYEAEETIIIDEQTIELTNLSQIMFIDAVRRITNYNFSNMISQNKYIHKLLDIKLKPVHMAIIHKKKEKKDTNTARMANSKTREIEIAKARKKKEGRL